MDLFGNLFDFNRDGTADLGEEMLGFGLLGMALDDMAQQAQSADGGTSGDPNENIQEKIDAMECTKMDLELTEPDDPCSDEWDAWNERVDALQEQIDELEAL